MRNRDSGTFTQSGDDIAQTTASCRSLIASTAKQEQDLIIDYAVHFVKANGATRPKVFKLRKVALPPAAELPLASTVSFADMTTHKHYPGRQRIDLLINGLAHPLTEFEVRPNP